MTKYKIKKLIKNKQIEQRKEGNKDKSAYFVLNKIARISVAIACICSMFVCLIPSIFSAVVKAEQIGNCYYWLFFIGEIVIGATVGIWFILSLIAVIMIDKASYFAGYQYSVRKTLVRPWIVSFVITVAAATAFIVCYNLLHVDEIIGQISTFIPCSFVFVGGVVFLASRNIYDIYKPTDSPSGSTPGLGWTKTLVGITIGTSIMAALFSMLASIGNTTVVQKWINIIGLVATPCIDIIWMLIALSSLSKASIPHSYRYSELLLSLSMIWIILVLTPIEASLINMITPQVVATGSLWLMLLISFSGFIPAAPRFVLLFHDL